MSEPYGIKKLRRAFEISQEPRTGMHVGLPYVTIEASLVAHALAAYDSLAARVAPADEALESIRVFAQDCIENSLDRVSLGNLFAIRDLCDRLAQDRSRTAHTACGCRE